MKVNLLSDTVTLPSAGMKEAMLAAPLGDDVFGTDPTVNKLQSLAAQLFGKEDALFCPSGTMTNQIAIQLHVGRTESILCEESSHIYQYETGGYAYNAGASIDPINGTHGRLSAADIRQHLRPNFDWYARQKLVVIENTGNKAGGTIYRLGQIEEIKHVCQEHDLALHLDGARIFNALAVTGEDAAEWGKYFDTISICLSKGLGAPVGSLLLGSGEDILRARRLRKVMGGGMRQAGILAAAGIYALENNRSRLAQDHKHASQLAEVLQSCHFVKHLRPVETNIVIFEVEEPAQVWIDRLLARDILAAPMGPHLVRLTTHLDVTGEMIDFVVQVLRELDGQVGG